MINYKIEIRKHAFIRAVERGIDPDIIEAAIKGGKREYFGKNYVKFILQYKDHKIICIGQKCGLILKIITIEKS